MGLFGTFSQAPNGSETANATHPKDPMLSRESVRLPGIHRVTHHAIRSGGNDAMAKLALECGPAFRHAEGSLPRRGRRRLRTGCSRIPKFAVTIMCVEDAYPSAVVLDDPHVVVGNAAVKFHSLGQTSLYELKLPRMPKL